MKKLTKSVKIIIPYFGKLPNYFCLWLESVKYNSNIKVLFLTNNKIPKDCPENVEWVVTTLENVKKRAQKLIDFQIVLNSPYKLVDYKPLYGAMFSDYITNYDWWGWGDIDTIWGDLTSIVNDDNLTKYDKLLDLGHLTLMKNTNLMKYMWKKKVKGAWTYEDALKSDMIFHFDEGGGMSFIARDSKCRIYSETAGNMSFADILPGRNNFQIAYNADKGQTAHIFLWKNGVLDGFWIENNKIKSKEYSYIHLQKRQMKIEIDLNKISEGFLIVPNKFIPLNMKDINMNLIQQNADEKKKRKSFIHYIKYQHFRRVGKRRNIPINGNEVYFRVEKPKY